MRLVSKVLLCTIVSFILIQKTQAQFTAINNGNWNAPATWQGGVVPTAGADVIIAATVNISHDDVTVGNFTINSGGTINSNYPYGVKLNSGKTFTNNGTVGNVFHVTFLGAGLVAGSATSNFTVVYIEGPVDFGTTSTVANLTINAGGSVNTNRPTYRTGSSLNYNTGGTYVIGDEWVTGNTNYPRALTINAGTTLSFGNITTSRRVGGVNDAMNINGGMTLSSAAGGDLIITSTYNNFNGAFNANGRTVTCLDGGSNCIVGGSQPVSFDNLVLNLPGKQFNLFTPVTVTTSATFTAGYTVINNFDFIVNSGVTITGASANCYAYTNGAGRLVMKGVGAGPVVAPIGRNIGNVFIHYNPVTITNGGGFDYAIKANATAPTGAGILNSTKVIRCQWDITPSGNPTNVDLKFQYINGQGVSGGTFSETAPQRGLRYNTGTTSWETIGTATPVGANPYNVSYTFGGPNWGLFSFESVTPPPPPPTITSFTPTSGPVGTTVTITGTNFNTTAANNIVFFGATKATVTAATATSLTVTVPVGATFGNITEVNMGTSLLAHSNANFTPTFTPNKSSIAATDFDPKIEIATGTGTTWPYQVALGDVDGDGKADLVVANRAANNVAVFRNTSTAGTVSFATRVDFSTAQEARGLVLVDLDGDGKLDIATTGGNLNQVAFTVLRNTSTSGNISFATKIEINTTAATYSIASADIDGNGKADLIFGGQKMIIYPNTSTVGNITFATPVDYTAAVNVNAIAVGDIDGDGKKDICFTAGSNVSVFRNMSTIGAISLASKVDFAAPSAYGMTIGDWDGDGKLDIAASLLNATNSMSILTNTSTVGNISFATRIDNSSPQNPYFVAGGDLNGDGKADLVTTNAGQNGTAANLSVYRNTSTSGAASFASNVNLALGSWPYYAAIGDIDGDGRPDIVSSSVEANRVAIFRNNPQFQTVVATGTLSAFAGCSGSASTSQSFTVSGSALTANLIVTAPTGYEVSTTAGSGYASSVTLTPASGMVASTTIYVRLTATATGSPGGNITVASTGATTQNIAVTGSVTTINNQTVSASPTSICGTGASVITVASTQTGVSYTLRNNANNAIVAGPIAGTGAAITFNTGTISTTTTYNVLAQTRADGALEFDGVDDNVYVNSNFPAATNFTWSAWVNLSSANNTKIFSTPSWEFAVINGKMSIWTSTGSDLFGLSNVPLNTWVHLAVTFNGSTVTFYIDGVVDQTFTSAATSLAAVPYLRIGSHHSGGCCFVSGKVDEVRLWNVSTSQSGIQAAMNNTLTGSELGLVSYYNFNEGTGSTLADLTSNARNGSLQNMNTANAWVAGRVASGSCSVQMTTTPTVTSTPAPTPTITAGGSTTFCTGGSVTLTASAGASYLWSNGATTQAITVTTGGSYTVQVTYSAGCFATSAATVVNVNPLPTPTITAGGPTTFCQGGSVTLTASAGSAYLWSNGATTQAITVSTAGNYNVRVTNANGCFATSANTTVTVNALPTASITAGGATTFCQGGSVVLTSNAGSSYLWSNNATTQSITATTSGNYTVTVTNANGCSTTSAVRTVTVNPLPVLTVTATPTSVSRGFNTQLNVTGSNLGTFAWTPTANLSSTTIANPIARVMSTTTYTVTVASSAGCTATGNVTVTALDDLNITSTNVFTPNGDGINDKFVIKNLDAYPNNKLQVMDRTGKVIYEKLNYANDWNGMVNGKLLTKDTYFFILIVNGQVLKKGTVTLVR